MKLFLKDLKNLIFDLKFIIPLVCVTIAGYGYIINHFAIGIDDLTRPRYIESENIAQGRFSGTAIDFIFGFTEYKPVWEDLLSIIFMFIAGILAAILLKRITKNSFHSSIYTFFACFFVTFPIINEIFLYGGSGLNIAIGYSLTIVSLIIFERFFDTKNYFLLIPCVLIWIFNISLYESFMLVYSCFVCGIMMIRHIVADEIIPCNNPEFKEELRKRQTAKKIFTEIGWYVGVLFVSVILEFIISNAVIRILGITASTGEASNMVSSVNIKNTVFYIFTHFICASFKYLPISIFSLCVIIGAIITIKATVKRKHAFYVLYFFGMNISIVALSLLRSGVTLYRNIQCMSVFCGIILVIVLQKYLDTKIKWKRILTITLASVLIVCQTFDLAKWFYVDYMRSEEEKAVMISVGNDLKQNYDITKPVIFTGEYTLSDEILDYRFIREGTLLYDVIHTSIHLFVGGEENCYVDQQEGIPAGQADNTSVISWGIYAFNEVNTELLRYYNYLGYDFIQGTEEQNEKAKIISESMEPQQSSYEIFDTDEFIVVEFG